MKKMIPSHHNQLENSAVRLMPLSVFHEKQTEIHRDDHYMFILQQKGDFVIEVDFNRVELKGPSVCFVGPGQIHRYIQQNNNEGWFLFVGAEAVTGHCREILDTYQWIHQSVDMDANDLIFDFPPLLEKTEKDKTCHDPSVGRSLAASAIGIIISRISEAPMSGLQNNGQKYSITRQFKKLIADHFIIKKQVQQYAPLLSITAIQ
ncbi:MAG: AraC family ligand binding domain-containing protein [Chryseobacterium sp.]|uniref:AraC family ligand binding domain-containing protein n=1 Tax=Chryseobacterium sp. TaxID=1871047 RepID=UPI0025C1BFDC|nr:AraC family ligand binding domain-containing protein [Chryseobacterium sp.]MCJ7932642.1 AraC family ligand binding domain-containing protein [Chryseobacterium sp.]